MEEKNEPKEKIDKPIEQKSKEEPKKEIKPTIEPPKKPEKKATATDNIETEAKKRLEKIKKGEEMWVCMVDKARNFFNSADEAHFYMRQGHCKKLPEVDLSKYDNYQEYPEYNTCQFLNPHTGREIVVPKGTKICPITGKPF